jgi:proline iminopeptidase
MLQADGLFDELEPLQSGRLPVEPPHELYFELAGNPEGLPAVFLHGGPGGGFKASQRRTFDPRSFRIVHFDQRGAGRSTPAAELAGNTTQALIADIERLREHLGIEQWLVTGGSWGSFLALAYGEAHPERCLGFRLHGIFLASSDEAHWWFHGIRTIFPDHWQDFAAFVPEAERGHLLEAYYRRLVDPDPAVHMPAAQALRTYSAKTQTFLPDPDHVASLTEPLAALQIARIFTHYCMNRAFVPEGSLLEGLDRIRHLPCEIVQGRYDVVTPMLTAWTLKEAWPEARFTIVDTANHVASKSAPALGRALREATDRLRDRLRPDLTPAAAPTPAPDREPASARAGSPERGSGVATYLRVRTATAPAISPDGGLLAFIGDRSGVGQVWTTELPGGTPRQGTDFDEKVAFLAFSPKSRDLVFGMDQGGDERQQLWLLPGGTGEARALTASPGVIHAWGAWDPDGGRIAFTANARDEAHMDVHVMEVASGESRCVQTAQGWRQVLGWWPDGTALLVQDGSRGMFDQGLVRLDLATGASETLIAQAGPARYLSPKWRKDGSGFFLITNQGQEFHGIAFFELETRELHFLESPECDVEALALSPDQTRLAFVLNEGGYSRIVVRDLESGIEGTIGGHPIGIVSGLVWRPDGAGLLFTVDGAGAPAAVWEFDGETLVAAPRVAADLGPPDPESLVEPSRVAIASFDGQEIPAFLFQPETAPPAAGYPAIVLIHGGPEDQFRPNFRAEVQYLLAKGILVLAPNVRGSTGYGRTWQSLDDRELRMDSVKDLGAVGRWLADQPNVDRSRLCLYGRSYGGFMVLAGLTEFPELWKLGVEFYGIANFVTLLETTGPWRRTLREVEYGFLATDRDKLLSYSPIRKADRIGVPLFVAHGLRDPRVPPSESRMIVGALEGRGAPVEYVTVPDEGHGFTKERNRQTIFGAMTAFVERHL